MKKARGLYTKIKDRPYFGEHESMRMMRYKTWVEKTFPGYSVFMKDAWSLKQDKHCISSDPKQWFWLRIFLQNQAQEYDKFYVGCIYKKTNPELYTMNIFFTVLHGEGRRNWTKHRDFKLKTEIFNESGAETLECVNRLKIKERLGL